MGIEVSLTNADDVSSSSWKALSQDATCLISTAIELDQSSINRNGQAPMCLLISSSSLEQREPLRKVAGDYTVSYDAVRRALRAAREMTFQREGALLSTTLLSCTSNRQVPLPSQGEVGEGELPGPTRATAQVFSPPSPSDKSS